jgi:hypothetical protein
MEATGIASRRRFASQEPWEAGGDVSGKLAILNKSAGGANVTGGELQ